MLTNSQTEYPFVVEVWSDDCSYEDSTRRETYVARRIKCRSKKQALAIAATIAESEPAHFKTSVCRKDGTVIKNFYYEDFLEEESYLDYADD